MNKTYRMADYRHFRTYYYAPCALAVSRTYLAWEQMTERDLVRLEVIPTRLYSPLLNVVTRTLSHPGYPLIPQGEEQSWCIVGSYRLRADAPWQVCCIYQRFPNNMNVLDALQNPYLPSIWLEVLESLRAGAQRKVQGF